MPEPSHWEKKETEFPFLGTELDPKTAWKENTGKETSMIQVFPIQLSIPEFSTERAQKAFCEQSWMILKGWKTEEEGGCFIKLPAEECSTVVLVLKLKKSLWQETSIIPLDAF